MTAEQYRCLAAHMMYWKRGLDSAMHDAGVTVSRERVIDFLFMAGYDYDGDADTLIYDGDVP